MNISESLKKKIQNDRKGKRLVFTGGAFDLFHNGHLHYLEKAKTCGDLLVVQIDSDTLVKSRKKNDPVFSQQVRYEIVSALKIVDFAVISDFPSGSTRQIDMIRPDVLVRINRPEQGIRYMQTKADAIHTTHPNLSVKFFQPTPDVSTTELISWLQNGNQHVYIEKPKNVLIQIAKKIISNGYSYSGQKIAAALYTGNKIFTGVNISNASPALALCAERVAIAQAVQSGERHIREMVILSNSALFPYPCGACRQMINEFRGTDDVTIHLINGDGKQKTTSISKLFPDPFISGRKKPSDQKE